MAWALKNRSIPPPIEVNQSFSTSDCEITFFTSKLIIESVWKVARLTERKARFHTESKIWRSRENLSHQTNMRLLLIFPLILHACLGEVISTGDKKFRCPMLAGGNKHKFEVEKVCTQWDNLVKNSNWFLFKVFRSLGWRWKIHPHWERH